MVSSDRGIYRSEDGGETWAHKETTLPIHVEAGPLPAIRRCGCRLRRLLADALCGSLAHRGRRRRPVGAHRTISLARASFCVLVLVGGSLAARYLSRRTRSRQFAAFSACRRRCGQPENLAATNGCMGGRGVISVLVGFEVGTERTAKDFGLWNSDADRHCFALRFWREARFCSCAPSRRKSSSGIVGKPQDAPIAVAAGTDGSVSFTIDHADAMRRLRDGHVERLRVSTAASSRFGSRSRPMAAPGSRTSPRAPLRA